METERATDPQIETKQETGNVGRREAGGKEGAEGQYLDRAVLPGR